MNNYQIFQRYSLKISFTIWPIFQCAPQSRRMKLTLQNEKRLAMLTELLKLCKYFVLYYPFPNIIIIIQHNNWQISIFGLYFFLLSSSVWRCPSSSMGKDFYRQICPNYKPLGHVTTTCIRKTRGINSQYMILKHHLYESTSKRKLKD